MPAQVLEALRFECTVVFLIGSDMHRDRTIGEADFERLGTAIGRIHDAGSVYARNR